MAEVKNAKQGNLLNFDLHVCKYAATLSYSHIIVDTNHRRPSHLVASNVDSFTWILRVLACIFDSGSNTLVSGDHVIDMHYTQKYQYNILRWTQTSVSRHFDGYLVMER